MRKIVLFVLIAFISVGMAKAQKFTVKNERGQKIKYEVTSSNAKTVQVIKNGYGKKALLIPESVSYKDVTYTVTAIGDEAFDDCNFNEIELPNTIEVIGVKAFNDSKLTDIVFPSSLREIKNSAFYNSNLSSIFIPEGVEKIGTEAFRKNNSVTMISVPESVTSIGKNAFPNKTVVIQSLPSFVNNSNCTVFGFKPECVKAYLDSKVQAEVPTVTTSVLPAAETPAVAVNQEPVAAVSQEPIVDQSTVNEKKETEKLSSKLTSFFSRSNNSTANISSMPESSLSEEIITNGEVTDGTDLYLSYNPDTEVLSYRLGYDMGSNTYFTTGYTMGFGDYVSSYWFVGFGLSERYIFKNFAIAQGHVYPYAAMYTTNETSFTYGLNLDICGGIKIYQFKSGVRCFLTAGYYTGAPEFHFDNTFDGGSWGLGITLL